MHVVMDRDLCDASLGFCQRCSAAFFRYPEGTDRLCITNIVDDGSDLITIEIKTDGRIIEMELTEEDRELASVEGGRLWLILTRRCSGPALWPGGVNWQLCHPGMKKVKYL
ncbi:MAG: hypothetical protein R3C44_06250 [Chloroflexota bacterium]